MNKREMKKRIFGELAGFFGDNSQSRKLKSLDERLELCLMECCRFKNPSRSQRIRFQTAKHEVLMIIYSHAGFKEN